MNNADVVRLKASFDAVVQNIPDSDVEFWFARDLQGLQFPYAIFIGCVLSCLY